MHPRVLRVVLHPSPVPQIQGSPQWGLGMSALGFLLLAFRLQVLSFQLLGFTWVFRGAPVFVLPSSDVSIANLSVAVLVELRTCRHTQVP